MANWGDRESPSLGGELSEGVRDTPFSPASDHFDFGALLAIGDTLPVMVAYCDTQERYQFVNKPIADWFEVPRREILGRTLEEIMGKDAYEQRARSIAQALAGETVQFTAPYPHPTRGQRFTKATYRPHQNAEDKIVGIIMVIEDVTEAHSAQQELRESEERFRRIADSAPIPIWVSSADGTVEFVNHAYADMLGLDLEAAKALSWADGVHPDDAQSLHDQLVEGLKSGDTFDFTARARNGEGDYRWMTATVQPRRDGDGAIVGYIGVANDITVAKEAEDSLRQKVAHSDARFRAVFDSLEMVGIIGLDGTMFEINQSALDLMNVTMDDLRGKKVYDIPFVREIPESRETVMRMVEQARDGEASTAEFDVVMDGMEGVHVLSIRPVPGPDGRPTFLVAEARDVSALKQTQEQLRQAQKMEALGQLTGGIAHDFNNLLTVVVGGLDMINRRVEDEKTRAYATNALAAAERGARLTGQLLAFSRVQKLEVRPVDIGEIIEQARPLLRNVLGPGIEKKFDLDEDIGLALADPTQLEVALLNLAVNSRDAMPEGGCLSFMTRTIDVDSDPELEPGRYVRLSVADTGSGIEEEVRVRVFEPFFTTKEVGKGTGLGLAMVYGMARQSGGTARIESQPGKGTTVSLLLRCAEADLFQRESEPSGERTPKRCDDRSVLVVDDDEAVRTFMADTLREGGFDVREAASGSEALKLYDDHRPDLVVLDYIMPGLSGAEVARKILGERPDQPILFVSGYSETDAIRAAAPEAKLLAKPFRGDALMDALGDLVTTA